MPGRTPYWTTYPVTVTSGLASQAKVTDAASAFTAPSNRARAMRKARARERANGISMAATDHRGNSVACSVHRETPEKRPDFDDLAKRRGPSGYESVSALTEAEGGRRGSDDRSREPRPSPAVIERWECRLARQASGRLPRCS